MRGADHQRNRFGLHLTDAAMLAGLLILGVMHQHMRQLMHQGGDLIDLRHIWLCQPHLAPE